MMKIITEYENVKKLTYSDPRHRLLFQKNVVMTHSFGNNATDVITALNCTYCIWQDEQHVSGKIDSP